MSENTAAGEGLDPQQTGGEGAQADGETLAAADKFVRLCNIVISELAGSYIPMVRTERVTAVNGRIYFTSLSMRALKIRQKAHAKISRAISPKTMQLANTPPQKSITNF